VLQALEVVSIQALLNERTDHTFDHPVLLQVMRRDEFMSQFVMTCAALLVPGVI
jgi:hypothetical protein